MISVNTMAKIELNKYDKKFIKCLVVIIIIAVVVALMTGCSLSKQDEFKLDLSNVVETGYGNTTDGDNMYWVIYEEWDNDCTRHLLYMDKETFDALEAAVEIFHRADLKKRDSLNNAHSFTLFRDSEGLHLGSIR